MGSLYRILGFVLAFNIAALKANAWTEKALDSSDPFVISPNSLDTDYFRLETKLPWAWVPGSFEWVRVDHRLLVPRARVRIEVPAGTPIMYQGKTILATTVASELLVILTQEENNLIEINQQKIPIRFKQTKSLDSALIIDSSCSSAPLHLKEIKMNRSWGFLYCHTLHPKNGKGYTSQIDLELIWEGEDPKLRPSLNGIPLSSQDGYTYSTVIQASTPQLLLTRGADSFELESKVSSVFHPLSFSIGLGPYSNQNKWVPFATLYAAYYFNEQMKLASFTALPIRSNPQIDSGLYVISEQFRGFDERMVVSLLLGAHILSFDAGGTRNNMFSAPQGVEVNFRDAFAKNRNLLVGFFYYPKISDRSYINSWIRYGNSRLFLEFNYIHWQEPLPQSTFESRSYGLSLGFPLFKAL